MCSCAVYGIKDSRCQSKLFQQTSGVLKQNIETKIAFVEVQSQHFAPKHALGINDCVWQEGVVSGVESIRW